MIGGTGSCSSCFHRVALGILDGQKCGRSSLHEQHPGHLGGTSRGSTCCAPNMFDNYTRFWCRGSCWTMLEFNKSMHDLYEFNSFVQDPPGSVYTRTCQHNDAHLKSLDPMLCAWQWPNGEALISLIWVSSLAIWWIQTRSRTNTAVAIAQRCRPFSGRWRIQSGGWVIRKSQCVVKQLNYSSY